LLLQFFCGDGEIAASDATPGLVHLTGEMSRRMSATQATSRLIIITISIVSGAANGLQLICTVKLEFSASTSQRNIMNDDINVLNRPSRENASSLSQTRRFSFVFYILL